MQKKTLALWATLLSQCCFVVPLRMEPNVHGLQKKTSRASTQTLQSKQTKANRTASSESRSKLTRIAKYLAGLGKYQAKGRVTRCSLFARDFVNAIGPERPEMQGRVKDQVSALMGNPKEWRQLKFERSELGLAKAFRESQRLADDGNLVLVAWVKPDATTTNSGHIAIVIPDENQAKTELSKSRAWGMEVPFVAQAGRMVSARMKLSQGFRPSMGEDLKFFVLKSGS